MAYCQIDYNLSKVYFVYKKSKIKNLIKELDLEIERGSNEVFVCDVKNINIHQLRNCLSNEDENKTVICSILEPFSLSQIPFYRNSPDYIVVEKEKL